MKRCIFGILALLSTLAPPAWARDLSALDFLVDGKALDGQQVTVKDCTVIGAMSSIVMCSAIRRGNSVGSVILDGDSMDRSALRRALNECSDMRPAAKCAVAAVTGKVRINRMGDVRIDGAAISWAKP